MHTRLAQICTLQLEFVPILKKNVHGIFNLFFFLEYTGELRIIVLRRKDNLLQRAAVARAQSGGEDITLGERIFNLYKDLVTHSAVIE